MQYSKLGQDEEAPLDDGVKVPSHTNALSHIALCGSKWFWGTVLILYSILLLLSGAWLSSLWNQNSAKIERLPSYDSRSPLLHQIDLNTHTKEFDVQFWPGSNPSIFRQAPSPEVDAAWERITNVRDIVLSTADILALGKDPATTVKARPEWGYGDDAHLGLIHVMHELHCLNALRKGIYYNHYYRGLRGFGANPPDDYRAKYYAHMDHCVMLLMESITCVADLTVTTYNWMEGESVPEGDFRSQHECRNFEGVLDWFEEHQINANLTLQEEEERWTGFHPRPGDTLLPQEPEQDASFWDVNMFPE